MLLEESRYHSFLTPEQFATLHASTQGSASETTLVSARGVTRERPASMVTLQPFLFETNCKWRKVAYNLDGEMYYSDSPICLYDSVIKAVSSMLTSLLCLMQQIAILNARMGESASAQGNADALLDLGGNIVIKVLCSVFGIDTV